MSAPIRQNVLYFRAGGQAYAMSLEHVEQVLPMVELSRSPGAPPWLAGFFDLAGEAIPVICLSRLFGLQPPEVHLYTPLMILSDGSKRLGLWVDHVAQVVSVGVDEIVAVPESCSLNDCAVGLIAGEDGAALLLALPRLLLQRERRLLEDLCAQEQQRVDQLEAVLP